MVDTTAQAVLPPSEPAAAPVETATTPASTSKILITGATGKQGGQVVDALVAAGQTSNLVALVRTPAAPNAQALKKKGVTLAEGSLTDEKALTKALEGVSSAFLIVFPFGKGGAHAEIQQGKTFIDAAKKASVKHIVFSSVEGAERKTGVPHFDTKWEVEEHLRASGIQYTIIRPVFFMENLPPKANMNSTIWLGLCDAALKGKKLQMVSTKDIAYFAAQALLDPAKYGGRAIPLAGDNLSMKEAQATYAKGGKKSGKAPVPGFMIGFLPKDLKLMFKWFHDKGYEADITALRTEHPALLTFEQYVSQK